MAYTTIDDPSAYFQITLYNGTAGLNLPVTITNSGNSDCNNDDGGRSNGTTNNKNNDGKPNSSSNGNTNNGDNDT